jgi:hypothetical protein
MTLRPRFSLHRATILRAAYVTLVPALGLTAGTWITLTSPFRDLPGWPAWASLAIVLTTAAGAVFVYGLERWVELRELQVIRTRDVAHPIVGVATLAVLLLIGQVWLTKWTGTWRGGALVAVTLIGGAPALGVMFGVRLAARGDQLSSTRGGQAADLIALRRLLQRLLPALGSLVALSTLALGAAMAMRPQPLPSSAAAALPAEAVIFFGAAGSLLVGLAYGPSASALRNCAQRLCDELFPLRKADEASDVLRLADERQRLEQLLGVDRSLFGELQSGLVILGPVLASAAAAFLPG